MKNNKKYSIQKLKQNLIKLDLQLVLINSFYQQQNPLPSCIINLDFENMVTLFTYVPIQNPIFTSVMPITVTTTEINKQSNAINISIHNYTHIIIPAHFGMLCFTKRRSYW